MENTGIGLPGDVEVISVACTHMPDGTIIERRRNGSRRMNLKSTCEKTSDAFSARTVERVPKFYLNIMSAYTYLPPASYTPSPRFLPPSPSDFFIQARTPNIFFMLSYHLVTFS